MPTNITGGLAVVSKDLAAPNTSTFDNVSIAEGAPNNPPQVVLTGPSPGPNFNIGTSMVLTAAVSDRDGAGSVRRVEFYNGSTLIGTDMTSPYSFTWPAEAGAANLRAKVIDTSGGATFSNAISLTVDPTGTLTVNPQADSYVRNGTWANTNYGTAATMLIRAGATDGNTYWGYLTFSIAGVSSVSHATLRVFGALSAAGSITVSACSVADTTWKESGMGGLTYTNRPGAGMDQGSFTIASTAAGWYEADLTSYIAAQKLAGATAISISLRGTSGATAYNAILNARTATYGKPELVLTP